MDGKINDLEVRAGEDLTTIRRLGQHWAEYRQVMREHTARFEQAGASMGADNYVVQKGLAARREVDSYARRLVDENEELMDESARQIRSSSEAELDRLRREKSGVSWA
ncbi:hypothetical protein [uncultured Leifsonia sp.]|uniref:hypothetical protein n=1 Tax=uncultured Leifsonia sp. TaxID=340359 RepID=UPI0025DA0024|nr:hypothetical protein [uncultured Leifsonia sp.]